MNKSLQITFGVIALVGLLVYTFVHTGGLLSRYVNPPFIGYVCALGIELSVVSLSLRIGDLRRSGQSAGFFWSVLLAVVVVSAFANTAEGYSAAYSRLLTLSSIGDLDIVQAVIWLSATGLISVIVLVLSEIIGTDVKQAVKLAEQGRRKEEREAETPETPVVTLVSTTVNQRSERVRTLLAILDAEPDITPTQLATRLHTSRTTVYKDLDRLRRNGRG